MAEMTVEQALLAPFPALMEQWDACLPGVREATRAGHRYSWRDGVLLYAAVLLAARNPDLRGEIVELGGGFGGASRVILHALEEAGCRAAYTVTEWSEERLPDLLAAMGTRAVVMGANHMRIPACDWPDRIRLLCIDAEHCTSETAWYLRVLWPRVEVGGIVTVHDMYPVGHYIPRSGYSEYVDVMAYVEQHPEWQIVAESWRASPLTDNPMYIGALSVFQRREAS